MPIYEYRCRTCNHCFEALVWPSKQEAVPCPCCNATDVERLLSTFSTCCPSNGGTRSNDACAPRSGGFS